MVLPPRKSLDVAPFLHHKPLGTAPMPFTNRTHSNLSFRLSTQTFRSGPTKMSYFSLKHPVVSITQLSPTRHAPCLEHSSASSLSSELIILQVTLHMLSNPSPTVFPSCRVDPAALAYTAPDVGRLHWVAACIRVNAEALDSRDQALNPGNAIYCLRDVQ